MSRGNNQQPAPQAHQAVGKRKRIDWEGRTVRIEIFILLVGCALLLAAVSLYLGFSGNLNAESKQVNSSEYQAVFLNNGQVYFGKLDSVNGSFFVLKNVYYLQSPSTSSSSSSTANNTYTLEKLGVNELHAPEDQMVINRSQVTFWENLKSSGKVVQAIQQYQKNPNAASQVQQSGSAGQSTSASQSSTSATQPTTGTGSTTTQP